MQYKILFVSHESCIGGSTVSLISLIQGLRKYNNLVIEVLLPYKNNAQAKQLLKKYEIPYKEMLYRYNFRIISKPYLLKYHIFDILNAFAIRKIQRYIKKAHIDIVCSNSTGVDVGARAALKSGVEHIYYIREFMEEDHGLEYRNKKQMKKLIEGSDYTIFISKAIKEKYCNLYQIKRNTQFYDGFILQDYCIDHRFILQDKQISFVQVGGFGDGKGTLNTIELLYQLKKNGITNWDMEFVGKGEEEYKIKMQQLIEKYHLESHIFIGEFCLDMKKKLAQKDILIMNSRAEGFGRVTVEGMLAGCLVIGRNQGGTTEIIENGVNGVTFNNDKEFLTIAGQIVSEREKYRRLAKKGQQYALEQFDCSKTAQNFMEFITSEV